VTRARILLKAAAGAADSAIAAALSVGRATNSNDSIHHFHRDGVLACQIANRNLTQDEGQRLLGNTPYHKTCADLPVDPSVYK
jgi:hypothetical protein